MAGRTLVETTVVFCLTTSTDKVFKYDGLSDVLWSWLKPTRGIKIQTCPVTKTLCVIGILKGVGWPAGTIVHCQKLTFSFTVCSCRYDRSGQSAFDKKGLKRSCTPITSNLRPTSNVALRPGLLFYAECLELLLRTEWRPSIQPILCS